MTAQAAVATQPATTAEQSGDYVLKGGWYTLWVMLAATLFGFVDRQVLTLAATPLSLSLGLKDAELGMVQGLAFAIFTVLAVYPLAWAADRFDRRLVLGCCIATWSIGTTACGFARNFEELFGAAVLIAAGEAGLAPIMTSFVPELFKGRKRIMANSLIYIFAYAGVSAGLALGGSAIGFLDARHASLPAWLQHYESWRLAFFLVALPAPILIVLLAFTAIGRKRSAVRSAAAQGSPNTFWQFLAAHKAATMSLFAGLGLYMLAFGGYLVWLPVAATRLFGTTPAQNGVAMGMAVAVGTLGGVASATFVMRRMIDRLGSMATVRFFRYAMTATIPVLAIFPFVTAAWQAFTLLGAMMLCGTAIGCAVPTLLQDMAPGPLRARMAAIWGIVSGLLGGSAPTLVGWVSTYLGTEPRMLTFAITLVAVPCWIGAIVCFWISERPFVGLLQHVSQEELAS
jgi:MFS family permease